MHLWPSVRQELLNAAILLTLVESSFDASWSDEVLVSDACLAGFAVHRSVWSQTEVRATGRASEKWRLKCGNTVLPARVRALRWAKTEGIDLELESPVAASDLPAHDSFSLLF